MKKQWIYLLTALAGLTLIVSGCGSKKEEQEETKTPSVSQDTMSDINQGETEEEFEGAERDLYDGAGNLLWEGKPKEELSDYDIEKYNKICEQYEQEQTYLSEKSSILLPNDGKTPEQRITDLAMEYDHLIPYAEGGRSYQKGYEKYEDGLDNTYMLESVHTAFGLDSTGYLIWIYRNAYGYTPAGSNDPISWYEQSNKLSSASKLEPGDVCLTSINRKNGYIVGIVIGKSDGNVVVSLCDNLCNELFPLGSSRLAYIKQQNNTCIGSSTPVDFRYYFRPEIKQEGEGEHE